MALPFFRTFVEKNILRAQYFIRTPCGLNNFHSVARLTGEGPFTTEYGPGNIASTPWSLISIRTKIRNNWPRPNERKRQNMNFWNRMKTPGGRAVIMRRYLKGRHILAH